MSTITLHCAHEPLATELAEWLAGLTLPVRAPVELYIEVGEVAPQSASDRAVFRQGRVAILGATSREPIISMNWGGSLGSATIGAGVARAHVTISPEGLTKDHELFRSFLLDVCVLTLRKAGFHHVHGAALIDPLGRGWLFTGSSGSGKSTTTALLARTGWHVGTDDIAFLTRSSEDSPVSVYSWREHVALRPDSARAFDARDALEFGSRRKTGWLPETLGSVWAPCILPKMLAFTLVDAARPTAARRIGARDAFERLMKQSAWVMVDASVADEHLGLMTSLTTQSSCFELRLGRDLFERPELLLEQVA